MMRGTLLLIAAIGRVDGRRRPGPALRDAPAPGDGVHQCPQDPASPQQNCRHRRRLLRRLRHVRGLRGVDPPRPVHLLPRRPSLAARCRPRGHLRQPCAAAAPAAAPAPAPGTTTAPTVAADAARGDGAEADLRAGPVHRPGGLPPGPLVADPGPGHGEVARLGSLRPPRLRHRGLVRADQPLPLPGPRPQHQLGCGRARPEPLGRPRRLRPHRDVQPWCAVRRWYLFYTGATPEGTTGYPPRRGGSPMDNLSAQGIAVSASPFGPWKRLGIVAPGGLGWKAGGTGGGFRPGVWNGLRVDSGRALVVFWTWA